MRLIIDTNPIIEFLGDKKDALDLSALAAEYDCFVSVITKLELLKYSGITAGEEALILDFLRFVPVMPLNADIEWETIAISRASKLKLPDAIIAATAIVYGAAIVSRDAHFLDCPYPALQVWQRS